MTDIKPESGRLGKAFRRAYAQMKEVRKKNEQVPDLRTAAFAVAPDKIEPSYRKMGA